MPTPTPVSTLTLTLRPHPASTPVSWPSPHGCVSHVLPPLSCCSRHSVHLECPPLTACMLPSPASSHFLFQMRKPRPRETCDLSKAIGESGQHGLGQDVLGGQAIHSPLRWGKGPRDAGREPSSSGLVTVPCPGRFGGEAEGQGFSSLTAVLSGEEPGRGAQGLAPALLIRLTILQPRPQMGHVLLSRQVVSNRAQQTWCPWHCCGFASCQVAGKAAQAGEAPAPPCDRGRPEVPTQPPATLLKPDPRAHSRMQSPPPSRGGWGRARNQCICCFQTCGQGLPCSLQGPAQPQGLGPQPSRLYRGPLLVLLAPGS